MIGIYMQNDYLCTQITWFVVWWFGGFVVWLCVIPVMHSTNQQNHKTTKQQYKTM